MASKLTPENVMAKAQELGLTAYIKVYGRKYTAVYFEDLPVFFHFNDTSVELERAYGYAYPTDVMERKNVPHYLGVYAFEDPAVTREDILKKSVFEALIEAGLIEGNGCHCAQWGSWKFHIDGTGDVEKALNIVKKVRETKHS